MGKLHEYAFAEIDSKEEIVVHLGRLAEPMSLPALSEFLRIPASAILLHATLPHNEAFARGLYRDIRDNYKQLLHRDANGDPIDLPPEASLTQFEAAQWTMLVYQQWRGEGQPDLWALPPVDLYLPRARYFTDQLPFIYASGTSPERIIAVERVEPLLSRVEPFEKAIEKLELAINRKFTEKVGKGTSFAELFGGVSMLRTTLDLQKRHWTAEFEDAKEISERTFDEHIIHLANIRTALDNFENAIWRRFELEMVRPEQDAADELLDMLSQSRGDADVLWAIDATYSRIGDVSCVEADKVIQLVHRACNALARSARVARFVDEHVVAILEESCIDLSPAAEEILRREGGQVGIDAVTQWQEYVAALRRGSGAATDSVLRTAQRAARAYRLGLSATSAILEQGVVAQVMSYLLRGHPDKPTMTGMQFASRGFALLVLRGLANNAVQHRAVKGELFVAGEQRLSAIVKELRSIDENVAKRAASLAGGKGVVSGAEFWAGQGRALKNLQVRPVPRSVTGAGVRVAVSAVVFGLALTPVFGEREMRLDEALALGSAFLNVGEHLGRSLEFVFAGAPPKLTWVPGDDALQKFDRSMKHLAGIAAMLGAISNGLRAHAALRHADKWEQGVIEVCGGVSNAAVAIGQMMMGPMQALALTEQTMMVTATTWMMRYGAMANALGVALGIGAFVAQIVYDEVIDVGVRKVFFTTLDTIEAMPRAGKLGTDVAELRRAASDSSGAMSSLRRFVGKPSDDPRSDHPTFWKAAKLGFSERAVQWLFDADAADVSVCLHGFYGSPADLKDGE